jgi:hypothetical protein
VVTVTSPPVIFGHGGTTTGTSSVRSIWNEQSSPGVTFNSPVAGGGVEQSARVLLLVTSVVPTRISGQNGGTSNGGQIGAAQSKIGGGGGGIWQSSIKSKSTTGINGTAQFLNSGSAMMLRWD